MNRIALLLLTIFIASCVTVAPVVNPNSEIRIYGVSSLPPQNGDWSLLVAAGYQMSLAKQGANQNESLAVNMSIFQLPEQVSDEAFLNYVIQGRASEASVGRFEMLKNTEVLASLNDATCVKYHSISKDKRAQAQGGETALMLLENHGYNCIHPINGAVGVNVEYSLRHYSETEYSTLEDDANEFFGNIKFTEF